MGTSISRRAFIAAALVAACCTAAACSNGREAAGTAGAITPADISFPGLQMRPGTDRSAFTLVGRVRNKSSRSTVTEVTLKVWMEDVLESGASTTLAPVTVVLRQEVPPSDSRSFEEAVVFRDLPKPRGRHEWNYAVTGLKAK